MTTVAVLTTGGTIASSADATGAKVAGVSGAELLDGVDLPAGVQVQVRDVLSKNSAALTLADLDVIRRAVAAALAEGVDGVVLTHGTDTTEETAFLLDLVHDDPRPVVLTGAQRGADEPNTDGPGNLRDALAVAADPAARGLGVLVVFDGAVHAARGTRKMHTLASAPFADPELGAVGRVVLGELVVQRPPQRPAPLSGLTDLADVRVDVVALYPGADATALDACAAAGARGLVLEAPGLGNANPTVVAAVRRHVQRGVHVLLSSRVPAGPLRAVYGGGGGGRDLVAAGAVLTGTLRPSQARVQLAALLAAGADDTQVRTAFAAS
ncbi:asparaginase [Rhodococcus sp. X156]|uniref:asparaginase n=1 Tax=Rhodococcus sp. X156 TaxID=2499145 RepID=UPI000FDC6D69|nr:asparaginase [Rhodococcus sp. X156]